MLCLVHQRGCRVWIWMLFMTPASLAHLTLTYARFDTLQGISSRPIQREVLAQPAIVYRRRRVVGDGRGVGGVVAAADAAPAVHTLGQGGGAGRGTGGGAGPQDAHTPLPPTARSHQHTLSIRYIYLNIGVTGLLPSHHKCLSPPLSSPFSSIQVPVPCVCTF